MKSILLRLDEALVEEIDRKRGDVPRTVWITRACESKARGTLDPRDYATGDFARDAAVEAKHTGGFAFRKVTADKIERVDPGSIQFGPVASTPGSRLKRPKERKA